MRVRSLLLLLALFAAGCRSTYHARAADLRWPAPEAEVVPATNDDGEPVRLRVDSILRVTDAPDGTQRAVAADGRTARNVGLGVLAGSLLASTAVVAFADGGDDQINVVLGGALFVVTAPVSLPFLAYGLWVGSPED